MITNILIVYLLINLLGGIYEIIRDRKDIASRVKETFEEANRTIPKEISRTFIYVIGFTTIWGSIFIIYVLCWAPMELVSLVKGNRTS